MSELKPCPFCASEANLSDTEGGDYVVRCSSCECFLMDDLLWDVENYDAKQNVMDKWNTRKSSWISVSDRLPDSNDNCLVCEDHEVYLGWYDCVGKCFNTARYGNDNEVYLSRVTHWQYLPEPPK